MKNLIFLSNYYPSNLINKYKTDSKSSLDFAAHNLNVSLREGFLLNGVSYYEINHPNIGNYPLYYKKKYIEECIYDSGYSVDFNNLAFFKRFSILQSIERKLEEVISQMKEPPTVLLYNFDFLPRVGDIKNKYPQVKFVLLITDIPEYMDVNNSIITRINRLIRNFAHNHFNRQIENYIDGFILLAPRMVEKIPINEKPWIQIEGIYNDEDDSIQVEKSNTKQIVYTGNLGYRYGIRELLEAFSLIKDDNYELIFRGSGEAEPEIREKEKNDSRIKLLPILTKKELNILQKKATILINPVNPSQEFSKYFFPSKTLEYLASGTPTLMGKLDCLPDDYLNYIYLIQDFTPYGLKQRIVEICSKPDSELSLFGSNASIFIHKNKTPQVQVKKIVDFISNL